MNIDITILLIAVAITLLVLPILVLLYVVIASSRAKRAAQNSDSGMSFEKVEKIFKSSHSSRSKLNDAVNYIIEHHVEIPPNGFKKYEGLITSLFSHKNVDKTLVLKFDRALNKANPQSKKALAKVLKSALNARD
ncbi:MAG: hypothetical protein U9N42_10360 [Campylobacterota bacterium]|nr:hypothetical protein [Campylobacterota bacterium]